MSNHPTRLITPQPDLQVTLVDSGTGDHTVLALHGGSGPGGITPVIDHYATRARVLAPTHPGWSGTPRPPWFTGVDNLAITYLDLLEDEALDDVTVIASSFGGWVASEMAVRDRGQRIGRVVLLDGIGPLIDGYQVQMPQPQPGRGLSQSDLENSLAYTGTSMNDPQLLRRLARVRVPALLIWGEEDTVVPPGFGKGYAQAFSHAEFTTVPGAGHMPALQAPDTTLDMIDTFLEAGGSQ